MKPLYVDCAATTPVYPSVVRIMNHHHMNEFGNPSSVHSCGERAHQAVENARSSLAQFLHVKPSELYFTSGATESNNWALSGVMRTRTRKKILISSIEHASVREVADHLRIEGYSVEIIPVSREGVVDLKVLEAHIDTNTALVSIIHVHNEFGTVQDIRAIGTLCKKKEVLLHVDAAQSFGKLPLLPSQWGVDLLSASAHKIGGPKGVGLLYCAREVALQPLIFGGGQERGMRSGTQNVAGIVGFAEALRCIQQEDIKKTQAVRDFLLEKLEALGGSVDGSKTDRIYNNINVSFPGVDGTRLVLYLSSQGIYCSTGSACESNTSEQSSLAALGLKSREQRGAIRLSLPFGFTRTDADRVVHSIARGMQTIK